MDSVVFTNTLQVSKSSTTRRISDLVSGCATFRRKETANSCRTCVLTTPCPELKSSDRHNRVRAHVLYPGKSVKRITRMFVSTTYLWFMQLVAGQWRCKP